MSAGATEVIPPIIPIDWNGPDCGIRISMAALDELGLPRDKRGLSVPIPQKRADHAEFADAIAATVRSTVMLILTGELPKEAQL